MDIGQVVLYVLAVAATIYIGITIMWKLQMWSFRRDDRKFEELYGINLNSDDAKRQVIAAVRLSASELAKHPTSENVTHLTGLLMARRRLKGLFD